MHHILKRFITPLAILLTTQIQSVGAETIRLVGPDGNIQSAPQYSQPIVRNTTTTAVPSSNTYGPTRADETLWSIATRLRPSNALSIQQTLLAIYRLNPQAFDNQNIHELIPGSRLRVPSLAQVQAESTEAARRILEQHQQKTGQQAAPAPQAQPAARPTPQPAPQPESQPEKPAAEIKPATTETAETKTQAPKPATEEKAVRNLKDKLTASEGELIALEEKNHKLRLMLSELQGEVGDLKEELGDESRIRSEVEKLLEEERVKQAEFEAMQPSQIDLLIENKLFVALLALIPGSLLVLAIVLFMTRRRGSEEAVAQVDESPVIDLTEDEDVQEINLDADLDDDLNIEDDLFGEESEENIFDVEDSGGDEESDIFANLDDSDLDFNLDEGESEGDDPFASIDDNGELSEETDAPEASSNGISVDGDDKALSLEEMERALDEGVPESETTEAAADDFDLADDDEISQDELNNLLAEDDPNEALDADELDQSMLDDLFNQTTEEGADDDNLDQNGLDFDSLLTDEPMDESEFELSEDADSGEPVLNDEDINDLLAEFDSDDEAPDDSEFNLDEPSELAETDDIDLVADESTELLDELIEDDFESDETLPEFDENSTELLDELIEDDEPDLGDFDLSEDSTALLDEIVESEDSSDSIPEITDDTTELLDELLGDDDEDEELIDLDSDSTALLDELVDDSLLSDSDEIELDENSTELLDELLEDEDFAADDEPHITNDIAASEISELSKDDSDIPDVLLEGFDEADSESEFDFSPEIEAAEYPEQEPEALAETEQAEPEQSAEAVSSAEDLANEFGVPQDEDWLVDEELNEEPAAFEDILAESMDQQEEELAPAEEAATQPEEIAGDNLDAIDLEETGAFEELVSQEQDEVTEPEIQADELAAVGDDDLGLPDEPVAFDEFISEGQGEVAEPETQADELAAVDDQASQVDEFISESLDDAAEQQSQTDALAEVADDEIDLADDQAAFEEFVSENLSDEVAELESQVDELAEIADDEIDGLEEEADFEELISENLEHHEEQRHQAESEPQTVQETDEELIEVSDEDLGEFDESAALDAVEEEGEDLSLPEPEAELDELLEISDDDLGEFDELSALEAAAEAESEELSLPETEAELDELLEISDDDLGEFDELSALEAAAAEESEELLLPESGAELDELLEISDDDLGEFDELSALEAAAEDEAEELSPPEAETELDELLEISDEDLGEFDEFTALDSAVDEPELPSVPETEAEPDEPQDDVSVDDDAFDEQAFSELDELLAEVETHPLEDPAVMDELLNDEPAAEASPLAPQELDSETIDSAGMDLNAMLEMGEDWNGFNLSEEQQAEISAEVPEDQQAIWGAESEEPQITAEDWGNQPSVDELEKSDSQFMSVEELMAQVEGSENDTDPDEEDLNLDVGLNEFPDVIGDIEQFDVDSGGEAAGKLDLAKIYIEMNDTEGAIKLLEEAIVYGEDATRQEAKALIDKLNSQS
ncbi:hypothetical protein L3Q72_09995 [Vibrio sp. JC009]|uniref:FimV/HubP family polar landmark protein n=1 Tax=Vibrio sp. JC009 TaxID=2912314 RepID=UPI0023B0F2AF|nr:FimV/HubP family polar landmark protein [Vibrio sp. JC009]WED20970.1 hypothetical protein L3Q72_09995 [Vibrio sp. JC009]